MRNFNVFNLTAVLVLVFFLFPALSSATEKKHYMPAAEGEDFLSYITEVNPYQNWELWPGTEELYEGTEPHGVLLTTYVNKPALKGIKKGKLEQGMPQGSIIVKENYSPEEELVSVTSMYKVEGFNPEVGDWFWVNHTPDEEIDAAGKVQGCIDCHSQVENRDYLFIDAHE